MDLSEVLDFRTILKCHKLDGELPSGVTLLEEKFSCPVFCLENRSGMLISFGHMIIDYLFFFCPVIMIHICPLPCFYVVLGCLNSWQIVYLYIIV